MTEKTLQLPRPYKQLQVADLAIGPPGGQRPIIQGVTFEAKPGQAIGVIGPSGSGKSTLARALIGAWPVMHGAIRLDGALLDQWSAADRGAFMGYLPQDVELFDGTIAENIARFAPQFDSQNVVKAAQAAGAHALIVGFPDGYETRIGEGGAALSGGQRQRIALARALYGDPFLLVLDEPNSSLDTEGDEALTNAIRSVKARNGIVIVVTHRPSGLVAVDNLLALTGGRQKSFGPRDEVLRQFMQQVKAGAAGAAPNAGQRSKPAEGPAVAPGRSMMTLNAPPTAGTKAAGS